MRRWFLILILCFFSTVSVFAQSNGSAIPDNCGYDPAALRGAVELDGWNFDDLIQFNWSSTCRYLSMRLPARHGDPGKNIVWDAVTNTRVGFIDGFAPGGGISAHWDPSGEYLVVAAYEVGTYLWHVPSNHQALLNPFGCGIMNTRWDYDHQVLYATAPITWGSNWCSPYINIGGLRVYSLVTGETVTQYSVSGYTLDYKFSDDGRYIIVFGDFGLVKIIDRSTRQVTAEININEGGGAVYGISRIDLSPSGRYLAVGLLYLRIWDLTQPDTERDQPVYRYAGPADYIEEVHFVDDNTIETVIPKDVQRWDVTTGTLLP